jgi:cyclophilin family peptidyl-prolyl cis-trans isomerase
MHRSVVAFISVLVLSSAGAAAQQPAASSEKPSGANPVVVLQTTSGNITIELDRARAPESVANFLQYVNEGFYSGTIFHRVIKGFMIQGGGMTADMQPKDTRPPVKNEATNGLKNVRGSVAMARTQAVRSATSQFFINTVDNAALDHKGLAPDEYGYAVFGKVIAGMDVVDKIENGKTKEGDVPEVPVVIKRAYVKQ